MCDGIEMVGLLVRDQEEALAYYVEELGFRIASDVTKRAHREVTLVDPAGATVELRLPSGPEHLGHAGGEAGVGIVE